MPVTTIENLSGRTFGNIEIGDIAGSNPRKYHLSCKRCRSQWVSTHTKIKNELQTSAGLTCANTGCTLPISDQMKREAQFFRDLKAKERAEAEAAEEARLRAKYGFSAPPPPAPKLSLDELTSQVQQNASELAKLERQNILAGLRDESFRPDPKYDNFSLPTEQVDSWNDEQANIFMDRCPEYFATPENSRTLLDYIWAQGVRLISAETFKRAYNRLMQFNLLETRPPEFEAVDVPPDPLPSHHEGYAQPKLQPQPMWDGVDLETGQEKVYSDYEVRRMTSDELRRKLRIPTAPMVRRERVA